MKIHMFYLITSRKEVAEEKYYGIVAEQEYFSVGANGKIYTLYAYTPENRCADEFMSLRDMKRFVHKVIPMDKEDYENFVEENPLTLLEYHMMKSIVLNEFKAYQKEIIDVLMTAQEANMVYESGYVRDRLENIAISPLFNLDQHKMSIFETLKDFIHMFTDEMESALRTLNFYDIMASFYFDEAEEVGAYEEDQLGVFIAMFGNTFRRKMR